jgi:U3 small nucleolar RNA-associated protein 4
MQNVLGTIGVPIWQMALEPSVDPKTSEINGIRLPINGHSDQHEHSDSDTSSVDDGDSSDNEAGSSKTSSSHNVNEFQQLALACDDGSVRLYHIPESGALTYYRALLRVSGMSNLHFILVIMAKFNSGSYVLLSLQAVC